MISILIPNFNYKIEPLVRNLVSQLENSIFPWEIIIQDDASPDEAILHENKQFITQLEFPSIRYIVLEKNVGNGMNRNVLAQKANYDWLLFLDSDLLPVHDDFLEQYIQEIQENEAQVVGGGIVYKDEWKKKFPLKYLHGKTETWDNKGRQNPYLTFRGSNFLIQKKLMNQFEFGSYIHSYGYIDTLFALTLQQQKIPIKLIANHAYHLDEVDSYDLIEKKEKSLDNLAYLYHEQYDLVQEIKIIKVYETLKKMGLTSVVKWFFSLFKNTIKKNLHGNHPNFYWLQFYQLGYFIGAVDRLHK